MAQQLAGRVALVTGGSRGIGAGVAIRLAREGAAVALTYANSPDRAAEVVRTITEAGGRAIAIKADSASEAEVTASVAQTVAEFGGLDILVNNAGGGRWATVDQATLADFDQTFAVNVRAVFVAVQAALPHLRDGGRIITIGSINGDRMPVPGGAIYAATKAALDGLTKGFARDLGPRGITVTNVQPGPVDTELNPADGPIADTMRALMALPRYGTVEEVASFVAYLAGPESSFITGTSLDIDGGFGA
ncbi:MULTISPECIES: 3-oxoacyl-ACP reductase family protein [unclassified Crossiella]|uniref:3-oxoacyl-ACP reductase family protein n=1 Tax=unclassified Crossiella TaxID=2620835 RepID=UPI001FFE65EA|nr:MULTISPECIES: 3-oxoacyl-ACP reductase family protein [unclassified Crossiella]MCK2241947.1 3-oxoacyl-ACP reductase FabG [Crossiella sp. S99.2]MCK2255850.1 3-oxoacyl-ACP reductase FabG [Crossiella sp. S99.1]